jgi:undecaprenyl-diphosphatase
LKGGEEQQRIWMLWKKAMVGVVPALFIGGLLGDKVEELLFNPKVVAWALMIGGIVLWWLENSRRKIKIDRVEDMAYTTALLIGLVQCIAMVPGTSRSAATIIGAMVLGMSRSSAAEYSFFLAIPTMAAATAYSLLKSHFQLTATEWQVLAVGFVVSFLVAWAVVALFMNYIRKNDFKPFAYYRLALGIVILLLLGKHIL